MLTIIVLVIVSIIVVIRVLESLAPAKEAQRDSLQKELAELRSQPPPEASENTVSMYIYIYTCVFAFMYVYIYTHIFVCMYVNRNVYIYVVYVCMYVCVCVYVDTTKGSFSSTRHIIGASKASAFRI